MNSGVIFGIIITLIGISCVGVYAMKKVKSSEDFTVGGRSASSVMVAGTILGSIVGGGGTVGTAQTAFKMGIVGWWQTLGLGVGCLVLGLFFAEFIYRTRVETVPQVLIKTYGPRIGLITSLFGSIAIFFSILSQLKSFIPLLTSMIPMSILTAACIGSVLIFAYVLFGGIWGTSMAGLVKMGLVYIALIICGSISFVGLGGFSGMVAKFEFHPWFNLFAHGASTDLATGLGLVLGVLVTQTYIQAVLSAKDAKAARNGAFLSAILTFPVGILGIVVGLYMRANFPDIPSAEALPRFILLHIHPILAGIFIATMMITTLGSHAGLTLGISTMLSRDIYKKVIRKDASDREMIIVLRTLIILVCALSVYFAVSAAGTLIQTFVFLSFGLRTCVFLVPMAFAFYYKGRISSAAGIASTLAGPIANIYWNLAKPYPIDPIYIGLLVALVTFIVVNKITTRENPEMLLATQGEDTAR